MTPPLFIPYRVVMEKTGNLSFEGSLKELEKIVAELEKGETPLEGQLKSFEKGVALSRVCMKQLEEVERKVEILMQNTEGKTVVNNFEFNP